jgi:hypothetical protein
VITAIGSANAPHQRLFAFELRHWRRAARVWCQDFGRRYCADDGAASTGCQRGNRVWDGTALSELRFLCVGGAKLRTEVMAVRCPPKFNVTIAGTKGFVAERTAGGTRSHYISAARDHQIPPPSKNKTRCGDLLNPAAQFVNASLIQGPRSWPGDSLCWRLLAEPTGIITRSQIHGSRTDS